jgi:lactate dehydrogenase-like 2-hydroxyacid dehydrogenase
MPVIAILDLDDPDVGVELALQLERLLHRALQRGWRMQADPAALDVFEGEPNVHKDLIGLPNAVLCPHIASASIPTRRAMANLAVDNLLAGLGFGPDAGRPPNLLNPEVLRAVDEGGRV